MLDRVRLFAHTHISTLFCCSHLLTDSNGSDNGSTAAKNLSAAKAASANVAAAEQSANSSDQKKAAQSEAARALSKPKKLLQRAPSTGARH
jgi:hypothetical protein